MKARMLTRAEEYDLIRRWQDDGDERAMQKLITAHMPLVYKMARKMSGYGLPYDDLVQEGTIGLMETLKKFDLAAGYRFATLSRWYVLSTMQEYIINNFSVVRHPKSSKKRYAFFHGERTRHLSIDSISAAYGGEDIVPTFLVDGEPLSDEIVEKMIDNERFRERLHRSMKNLTPREKDIIQRRFLREDSETLDSIAQSYGISRERVRQIEQKALTDIKIALAVRAAA